eukprot:SAG11_NODE_3329_length_2521_cov_1.265483_3_plen_219_part_00
MTHQCDLGGLNLMIRYRATVDSAGAEVTPGAFELVMVDTTDSLPIDGRGSSGGSCSGSSSSSSSGSSGGSNNGCTIDDHLLAPNCDYPLLLELPQSRRPPSPRLAAIIRAWSAARFELVVVPQLVRSIVGACSVESAVEGDLALRLGGVASRMRKLQVAMAATPERSVGELVCDVVPAWEAGWARCGASGALATVFASGDVEEPCGERGDELPSSQST